MDTVKIIQIMPRQWTGDKGLQTEVVGLGDDGQVYQWHRGTGKWLLAIISN